MSASPLEEIQERERYLRDQLLDHEVTEIDLPRAFFHEQIGLRQVMVDQLGRFWDVGASPIRMIFDPKKEK